MKKLSAALCCFVILFTSHAAWSVDDVKVEAGKLLDAMNTEMIMQQSITRMLDLQIQQNPKIAPLRGVMLQFLEKHMSYKSIKQDLIDMYASEFSSAELVDLRRFYETPTGKKAVEKMPILMSKGGELGTKRVQENTAELQQMIMQELERIRKNPPQ